MKRIYEDAAYQPPTNCWWRYTTPPADLPALLDTQSADVAIIGGGFTGLNAALGLAQAGRAVTVLDAEQPGWGASGRNGGFCCLGGAKASSRMIARRFGQDQLATWHSAERAAIDHVAGLLDTHDIDADRHSKGETLLAHSPRVMHGLRSSLDEITRDHGVTPQLFAAGDLPDQGLNGRFHGGLTLPLGFALNPAKYHAGLFRAALSAGVEVFGASPASAPRQQGRKWRITTPRGSVTADQVILATNGYSSEDVPDWLRARYLPVQSSVIVTRPITAEEQARQGWTSGQMCYDSRILLHYFRLMPDGRFLFGMRGGMKATPGTEAALSRKIRRDFHHLFPEWRDVGITHDWSGLVCLMRALVPFAGPVPEMPGVFAALGYHGNGVAMGSYLGARIADTVLGRPPQGPVPEFLSRPPKRFPLGGARRMLLAPAYTVAGLMDR